MSSPFPYASWGLVALYPDGWPPYRQAYRSRREAHRMADDLVMSNQRAKTWGPGSDPRCWILPPGRQTPYRIR